MNRIGRALVIVLAVLMTAGWGFAQKPKSGKAGSTKAAAKSDKGKDPSKDAARDDAVKAPRPVRAPTTKLNSSEPGRVFAEVETLSKEKPILLVHYPWKLHSRPSVEVRMLREDDPTTEAWEEDPDTAEVRPLGFVARIMKGDVTLAVHRCLDLQEDAAMVKSFKQKDYEFDVIAARNDLGRAAGKVVFPPKHDSDDPMPRAAYYPLEPWAADAESLRLELPGDHFSKPGRLRVWFLREGNIVWWQTVRWPGIAKATAAPPTESGKAADANPE